MKFLIALILISSVTPAQASVSCGKLLRQWKKSYSVYYSNRCENKKDNDGKYVGSDTCVSANQSLDRIESSMNRLGCASPSESTAAATESTYVAPWFKHGYFDAYCYLGHICH